jgi:glucose-fructose oxidoreductase
MRVRPNDIRTRKVSEGGGTLYDIGVYCINAARHIFESEPQEVIAVSVNSGAPHLAAVDESTAAILRFDGGRVASFVTSFNATGVGSYHLVGTTGDLRVDPAYAYAEDLAYELTVDGQTERRQIPRRDQFAAELLHFSDCILEDRAPEPSGADGLADIKIVRALYASAETGRTVAIRDAKVM